MRTVTAVLFWAVAACAADRVTTVNPAVSLLADAWSGDTLAIYSASFSDADTVPLVTVGNDTLQAWRGGPDTVLVLLPDTAGVIGLTVRLHGGGTARAEVTVHGLSSAHPAPVAGDGAPYPYPWPGASDPTGLAIHRGRLVLVDYRANTYAQLAPDTDLWVPLGIQQFPNPVPSAWDRRLVSVSHGTGPLQAVAIMSGAPAPDSGPPLTGLTQIHLGRGTWLVSYKNSGLQLLTRLPGGAFTAAQVFAAKVEGSYVISPRGDRVVPTHIVGGLFAFDPAAATVAFSIAAGYTGGAAFSAAGDTLYAIRADSNGIKLVALDATSGLQLREVPVWNEDLEVVVDPNRPWLYLAGVEGSLSTGHLAVYVYDRASLTRIATLKVPAAAIPPTISFPLSGVYVLILDALRRQLYLTMSFYVDPEFVFQFDLLP